MLFLNYHGAVGGKVPLHPGVQMGGYPSKGVTLALTHFFLFSTTRLQGS